jgi:hypothetical protein
MTQQRTDLGERGAMTQHLSGQSVAKLMCPVSRRINPSTLKAMTNDRTTATGALKAANRSSDAKKYATAAAQWPSTPQVCGYSFADVARQRHLVTLAAPAMHTQLSRAPVDILEFQRDHFICTQSQPCQYQ